MNGTETEVSKEELTKKLHDYVAYVLTSSSGLYREPHSYGPMRLVDSLEKTLELLKILGVTDASIEQSMAAVRESRWCAGTDPEQFKVAIDKSILQLVEVTLENNKVTS